MTIPHRDEQERDLDLRCPNVVSFGMSENTDLSLLTAYRVHGTSRDGHRRDRWISYYFNDEVAQRDLARLRIDHGWQQSSVQPMTAGDRVRVIAP